MLLKIDLYYNDGNNTYRLSLPPSVIIELKIALFMFIYYNIVQRKCEVIIGNFVVSNRDCLAPTLNFIIMHTRKINRRDIRNINLSSENLVLPNFKKPNNDALTTIFTTLHTYTELL